MPVRVARGAADRLTQPVQRDKISIVPLPWVSQEGRMLDFWVDWGDGKTARPVMLAPVDVVSNMALDRKRVPSENAADTVRLISRTWPTPGNRREGRQTRCRPRCNA